MKRNKIITGLDIGSSKVSAVAAEVDRLGSFSIAAHMSLPSRGVSRGAVENLDEAVDSVSKVLARLRDKLSARPENIYVNISGKGLKGEMAMGMIPIALRGREITKADMERCVNVASTINLPIDREIIHRIVHRFSTDGISYMKSPLGLHASRLTCEAYIISADVNHIHNIYKCVNNAGYDVKEIVFTGLADGYAVLDQAERENNAVLLDIGESLTEISIFSAGALTRFEAVLLGAKDIKGNLGENPAIAEIISKLDFITKETSIILTGGAAFIDGMVEFLEEKLSHRVKMGTVKEVMGDISSVESMKAATAIGLARYGYELFMKKTVEAKNPIQFVSSKVVDLLNNYF